MKIAIDARVISSGTGRYVERLLTNLEALNPAHEFLVLVPSKDLGYWRPTRPNFRVLSADFANYSLAEQLPFYEFLSDLRVDLVHFCMPQQPLLYSGRKVTTVHDLNLLRITETDDMSPAVLKIKQQIFKYLLKYVSKTSAAVITPSSYTKHDLLNLTRIREGKVSVTYEAADKLLASPTALTQFDGKQFLLYVGRAEPYKNNRGLIKAHQMLLSKFPALQLVIVGAKDEFRRRDEAWAVAEKCRKVTFFGFASDAQLAWLYANTAAYVVPSFMEGFGLPGLEAMMNGAPVISSDATCLPEIYGEAALFVDAYNPTDMAAGIERVLSDGTLAAELRTKGGRRAAEFSWRRMAKQTLAVYETALSGPGRQ